MSDEQTVNGVKPLKLYAAMHAARKKMGIVGKSGHNSFDKYDYATIADFVIASQAGLDEFGLLVTHEIISEEWLPDRLTSNEKLEHVVRVRIRTTCIDVASGESMSTEMIGEGQDRGDKAYYKANTGARKYALANLFNLASGDDPETHSPETVAKQQGQNPFRERGAQRRPAQRDQKRLPAQQKPAAKKPAPVLTDETDLGAWERHDLTAFVEGVGTTSALLYVLNRLSSCPVWLAHVGDWQWACKQIADRYRQMVRYEGCDEHADLVDRLKEEHRKLEELKDDPFGEKEKPDGQSPAEDQQVPDSQAGQAAV